MPHNTSGAAWVVGYLLVSSVIVAWKVSIDGFRALWFGFVTAVIGALAVWIGFQAGWMEAGEALIALVGVLIGFVLLCLAEIAASYH